MGNTEFGSEGRSMKIPVLVEWLAKQQEKDLYLATKQSEES